MILLLAWACTQEPTPLPPRRLSGDRVSLRRVHMNGVDGLLGRPLDQPPSEAVLLLVDTIDAQTRARVIEATPGPQLTLAITISTDIAQAERYLTGATGDAQVTIICERQSCP